MQVLSRRTKNNPVLIGEPGVGKTAIAEGLAQRIVAATARGSMRDKRIIALDVGAAARGREVPRRVRGAAQGGAQARSPPATARSSSSSTSCTPSSAPGAAEGAVTRATCSSRRWRAASCAASARRRSTSTASTSRRTRRSSGASSRSSSASRASRTRSRSCAGSRSATRRTTACGSRTARSSRRRTLSHRYIADRFLPDKAIDLIDEAASAAHRERQHADRSSTSCAGGSCSSRSSARRSSRRGRRRPRKRARIVERELAELRRRNRGLTAQWEAEKAELDAVKALKERDRRQARRARAGAAPGRLEAAARIQYGEIRDIEAQLEDRRARPRRAAQAGGTLVKRGGRQPSRSPIVSQWTGIPVSRSLETEREKLQHGGRTCASGSSGRTTRSRGVRRRAPQPRRAWATPTGPSALPVPRARRAWARPRLCKALAEFLFDTEDGGDAHRHERVHGEARGRRLIGAPPGLRRLRGGRPLTEAVRRRPYS
jgi:ATP-dependent Clp protease ATP-binding subunit ClpB